MFPGYGVKDYMKAWPSIAVTHGAGNHKSSAPDRRAACCHAVKAVTTGDRSTRTEAPSQDPCFGRWWSVTAQKNLAPLAVSLATCPGKAKTPLSFE